MGKIQVNWIDYDPNIITILYNLFVGNKKNHIIFSDTWKRSFLPISRNLLIKHVRHEIAIGSYAIYNGGAKPYCKWICIDIDSHERVPQSVREEVREEYEEKTAKLILKKLEKEYSKRVNQEVKKKHLAIVLNIFDCSEDVLGIPSDYIIAEDSVGGYHIWIFLKEKTLLEDVGKWVYKYRDKINEVYTKYLDDEELPEIYPKQYGLDHLHKGLGNGVRIPLGYNFNKKGASKMVLGYISKVKKFDLHELVKDIEIDVKQMNGFHCRREVVEVYDAQEIPSSLDFWLELPIRECFKWIINGKTQCFGEHGHFMRMALVHECKFYKMSIDTMVECFRNQYDYDELITKAQLESVLNSTRKRDGRYGCEKIKQLGYCHGCNRNKG
jgi:hypothetical protein